MRRFNHDVLTVCGCFVTLASVQCGQGAASLDLQPAHRNHVVLPEILA